MKEYVTSSKRDEYKTLAKYKGLSPFAFTNSNVKNLLLHLFDFKKRDKNTKRCNKLNRHVSMVPSTGTIETITLPEFPKQCMYDNFLEAVESPYKIVKRKGHTND